ncbi:hypothetical protein ACIG5E_31930 [Kitasatospora sp. NPDC053057]|uniref:hypothetical protein n=1 Tax=Kitasatospora sp. NPDC053057 TaxID=3364062 RepID=UPI0037C5525F
MQTNAGTAPRTALVGGFTVRIGELAGPGRPSEDRAVTSSDAVIVLDGVSTVTATRLRAQHGRALTIGKDRCALTIGFFGTSIMEHLEGYNAQLVRFTDRADARIASELGRCVA